MNSIILSLFQYWRHRSTLCVTNVFLFLNFFTFFISLAFIADDEYLAGLNMIINSPNSIGIMVFILFSMLIKQHVRLFYSFWSPRNKELLEHYQIIEDRLYMEEYEDPDQVFEIRDSVSFANLVK
jgi:ABC-type transport system involved in cytochrome c biogenesis permease subunit